MMKSWKRVREVGQGSKTFELFSCVGDPEEKDNCISKNAWYQNVHTFTNQDYVVGFVVINAWMNWL